MELLVISLTLDLQEAHESLRINDIYIYIVIKFYLQGFIDHEKKCWEHNFIIISII